ncbi:MAG: hypothetical protein LBE86_15255 [Gemmobacter sp.]|nr:hypothetical protein [Gemmobacter sp.]
MRLPILILILLAGFASAAQAQAVPSRQGMAQAEPGLWVDMAAAPGQIATIRATMAAAAAGVGRALGATRAVEWRICTTSACDKANGMVNRGMTYGASIITLNSTAWNDRGAYMHELTHATLHSTQPLGGFLGSRGLPLWFNEGVAVLVSGEPARAARDAACDRPRKGELPQTPRDFARLAPDPKQALKVYIRSACAVREWLKQGHELREVMPLLRAGRRLP